MYRIYEISRGTRRLVGGTPLLETARAIVVRVAGNPLIDGAAMGSYRGPNEFLPRIMGETRYEILKHPGTFEGDRPEAA